jgi:hypothetical protein
MAKKKNKATKTSVATKKPAFLDDLRQTLDKFGVPQPETNELFAIVDSTRGDIVASH